MTTEVKTVGDAEFRSEVLESEVPVLVDFTARWCPPCRALSPVIEGLAADYRGQVKFAQVDVDDQQQIAEQYGIRAMPTILLFSRGRVVRQIVGAVPRQKLEAAVREVMGAAH